MFLHNIKSALRHIARNRTNTLINISGLSIGIACCLVIFLYVYNEMNYDKYIPERENIYRIKIGTQNGGYRVNFPHLSYPAICENIPELEYYTLTYPYGVQVAYGEHVFKEPLFSYTDSTLFKIFKWKVLRGDPDHLLNNPYDIVISKKVAEKYFGNEDPVGKILRLDNRVDYTVSGIIEEIPEQSHIQGQFFVNISSCPQLHPQYNSWIVNGSMIYIKIKDNTDIADLENKLSENWKEVIGERYGNQSNTEVRLQPLSEIYFNEEQLGGPSQYKFGNYRSIVIFSVIGLLILLIACFNYLNLTFAKLYIRWVETGIRKTNGANNIKIAKLFITESTINVLVSIIFGIIIAFFILPLVNQTIGKNIDLYSNLFIITTFLALLFLFIISSTGLYPSLVLARINPVDILNRRLSGSGKRSKIREWFTAQMRGVLISFQFTIIIVICICTIVIIKQLWYITHVDLGYETDKILVIKNPWDEEQKTRYDILCEKAKKIPQVEIVSGGYDVPVYGTRNFCGLYDVNDPEIQVGSGMASVDYDYLPLLGIKFIEGRNFSPEYSSDSLAVIITESAAEKLRFKNPVGGIISGLWDNRSRHIIGIVNDMKFNSSRSRNFPMVFECRQMRRPYCNKIILKLKTDDYQSALNNIKDVFKETYPDMAFVSFSLNEMMSQNYYRELQLQHLMFFFTGLSFALCIMGLLGVALIYTRRRAKEIGIRKANGAKVLEVITLLNKDFVIFVTIAFIVASPLAWHFANKWLENFYNQTKLNWWVFALTGFLALIIAILTVSLQSWNAASRNPVEALRYE